MDIAPIKTQRDYRRALKRIEGLMRAKRNTPAGDRLDVLVTLVEAWEAKHFALDLPDFLDELEKRLPPGFHEQAQLTLLNETAGLFATHPTAAQRIQKARKRAEAGIFAIEKPARALFTDFTAVSRLVTGRHYRQTSGRSVPRTVHRARPIRTPHRRGARNRHADGK